MKKIFFLKLQWIALAFFIISGCGLADDYQLIPRPKAEKIKKEITTHGDTRIDYYYWLNDRENPKVIEYLNKENEYTEKMLSHTADLQKKLFTEITSRIKQNDEDVPVFKNGYYNYSRYDTGKQYPVVCRKKEVLIANEEIILDGNVLAAGKSYFDIGDYSVSSNNNLLAYSLDTVSRRKYFIQIKDLKTNKIYKDVITNTSGDIVWASDNKTIFYIRRDEKTLRECSVLKHTLGTPESADQEVYYEKDSTCYVNIYKTKSQKYVVIQSYSTMTDESRIIVAAKPNEKYKVFAEKEKDIKYSIDHVNNMFYIRTNQNAKNFRFMSTTEDKTAKSDWKEIIPNRTDVLLQSYVLFNNYIVLMERKNGLEQIRVLNLKDNSDYYMNFDEQAFSLSFYSNPEPSNEKLLFDYVSMTTPNTVFEYNLSTKEKKQLKQDEVLGKYNSNDYYTERIFVTAKDGAKIPVTIEYKKGLIKEGTNPCLIYAYGSYGSNVDPWFSISRISLLNRGFVFAIAHVRGGQEMGRDWYENGKLLKKKNTFTDFNDCAEYLISQKYTNAEKLFAQGGSAGGLLMGAIANIRPDLYKGIIAQVPFVDVITTMLDESIPLTTNEFDEWGNPKNKEYYDYMKSYSPYDNVVKQKYPAMLVTTGLHDSQVQYWEPAKWVAKLREYKTDGNPLLLDIDMKVGHGGASGRFDRYKMIAKEYAFMLDLLGVKQ